MLTRLLLISLALTASLAVRAELPADFTIAVLGDDVASADILVLNDATDFSLTWGPESGEGYAGISAQRLNRKFDDMTYSPAVIFRLLSHKNGKTDVLAEQQTACDGDMCGIRVYTNGRITKITGGHSEPLFADGSVRVHVPLAAGTVFKVHAPEKSNTVIARRDIAERVTIRPALFSDTQALAEHIAASRDSLEGYWQYLDRNISKSGVDFASGYRIATVRDGNSYQILYLGEDNGAWKPLMVKGLLHPTIFINHFDLEWLDAQRLNHFTHETSATISESESILTLSFPLFGARVRFRRIPAGAAVRQ